MAAKTLTRCAWLNPEHEEYARYHDELWGVPVHEDRVLFEMLILEGAQAGLSWETILKRRANYQKAFFGFDIRKCSKITEDDEAKLLLNEGIIRNRLKIKAVRTNALAFLEIQKEYGSFDAYLWKYVDGKPLDPKYKTILDIPVTSGMSDLISKDLKQKGMKFIGSTIIQAYLQAIGMINAHTTDCYRHKEIREAQK